MTLPRARDGAPKREPWQRRADGRARLWYGSRRVDESIANSDRALDADRTPIRAGKDHQFFRIARRVPYGGLLFGARALILQVLHPAVGAGVAAHSTLRQRPIERLRRTSEYVLAEAFADDATLLRLVAHVNRRHAPVKGTHPVTGAPYSANDPKLLEWVHLTEIEALVDAYKFVGGRMTPEEESRVYEVARFGPMLLGSAEPAAASLAEKNDVYARTIPELALTDASRDLVAFLLAPRTRALWWAWPLLPFMKRFTISQLPDYARDKLGVRGSMLGDRMIRGAFRVACVLLHPLLVWINWKLVGDGTKAIWDSIPDESAPRAFTVPVPRT